MKNVFFAIAVLFSLCVKAQKRALPYDKEKGLVVYELVNSVDSISKDVIFDRTKFWIAQFFNSSKHVIDFEDKENGKLTFSGTLNFISEKKFYNGQGHINFKAIVQVKDSKYKISIYNFEHVFYDRSRNYSCGSIEKVYNSGMRCNNGLSAPALYANIFHYSIENQSDLIIRSLFNYITNPNESSLFTDDF
jgi:hypothetical protein